MLFTQKFSNGLKGPYSAQEMHSELLLQPELIEGASVVRVNALTLLYLGVMGIYSALRLFISFGEAILDVSFSQIRLWVFFIARHAAIRANTLLDLVVYDRLVRLARFVIIYILYSLPLQARLRLRSATSALSPIITIMDIFANANWGEREVMDMFGIRFLGHLDFRRLLADYGFWGFPGRKDFPVVGTVEYYFILSMDLVIRLRIAFEGTTGITLLNVKQPLKC